MREVNGHSLIKRFGPFSKHFAIKDLVKLNLVLILVLKTQEKLQRMSRSFGCRAKFHSLVSIKYSWCYDSMIFMSLRILE